ncbi:hypothetical protein MJT46_001608 [Ovis ammon polii x Ovis aries]|nr:hypothetical protein MJT46_001608 [Ovis ammon polii x Ovis aries]
MARQSGRPYLRAGPARRKAVRDAEAADGGRQRRQPPGHGISATLTASGEPFLTPERLTCHVAFRISASSRRLSGSLIDYQGFQVQLKSVKQLNDLADQWVPSPGLQDQSPQPSVCHHPALPLDLRPICASKDAASIFQALRTIADDDCELCVNVACTGCS